MAPTLVGSFLSRPRAKRHLGLVCRAATHRRTTSLTHGRPRGGRIKVGYLPDDTIPSGPRFLGPLVDDRSSAKRARRATGFVLITSPVNQHLSGGVAAGAAMMGSGDARHGMRSATAMLQNRARSRPRPKREASLHVGPAAHVSSLKVLTGELATLMPHRPASVTCPRLCLTLG